MKMNILPDSVATNIVIVLAELVEILCSLLRRLLIKFPELFLHMARTVCKNAHDSGVQKVPLHHIIFF